MPELRNPAIRDYVYRAFFTQNATSNRPPSGDLRIWTGWPLIIMEDRLAVIHDVGVSSGVTSLELHTRSPPPGSP